MYKNIVWDVDGTLFDTYPAIVASFMAALHDHGVDADSDWVMQLAKTSIGHCVGALATRYGLPEDRIEQRFQSHYEQIGLDRQPPFPGVRQLCMWVCAAGGKNVIVTHRGIQGTLGLLQTHLLGSLFSGWITRDDGYPKKPDPSAFKAALGRFDLRPSCTIAIGDRDIDTVAAQKAGLFACQYTPHRGEAVPDLVFSDFATMLEFLKGAHEEGEDWARDGAGGVKRGNCN